MDLWDVGADLLNPGHVDAVVALAVVALSSDVSSGRNFQNSGTDAEPMLIERRGRREPRVVRRRRADAALSSTSVSL